MKRQKKQPTLTPNVTHYLGEMYPRGFLIVAIDENNQLLSNHVADGSASMFALIKGMEMFLDNFYQRISKS